MKITEIAKRTVELFKSIKYRRETERILDTQFYAVSSGVVGLATGVVVGILAVIWQMVFPASTDSVVFSIIALAFLIALLVFAIWMIYPLVLDVSTPIMDKVINTLVVLIVCAAAFFLGVYGLIFIIVIAICYLVLKIAVPLMFKK